MKTKIDDKKNQITHEFPGITVIANFSNLTITVFYGDEEIGTFSFREMTLTDYQNFLNLFNHERIRPSNLAINSLGVYRAN
jgi:hypothetical protein